MLTLLMEYLLPVVYEDGKPHFSARRLVGYSSHYALRNLVLGVVVMMGATALGGFGESLISSVLFVFGCAFCFLAGLFTGVTLDMKR